MKCRGTSKSGVTSNSLWKSNWKKNTTELKPKEDVKAKSPSTSSKGKSDTKPFSRTRDVKCFRCQGFGHIASQCPNQRAMIILDNGDVESVSSGDDDMPPLEDCSDVDIEGPVSGELLVTRRVLSTLPKDDGEGVQREHIFHPRCHV